MARKETNVNLGKLQTEVELATNVLRLAQMDKLQANQAYEIAVVSYKNQRSKLDAGICLVLADSNEPIIS